MDGARSQDLPVGFSLVQQAEVPFSSEFALSLPPGKHPLACSDPIQDELIIPELLQYNPSPREDQ